MTTILKDIIDSPKFPDYMQELNAHLANEDAKRIEFYTNVRDDEKVEFINGEIICSSPAKHKHTLIVENLGNILSRFVRKSSLGLICREKALVKLRRNDFEPDICFFRKELADKFIPDTMFYPVPDFVVEVLSSSTEKRDRGVKFVDYALNGVKEYWLIDPDKRIVEQYFLEGEVFTLAEKISHATVKCGEIKGLEIPLEAIFNEIANDEFVMKM